MLTVYYRSCGCWQIQLFGKLFCSLQAPHNTVNYAIDSATAPNGVDEIAYFQINPSTGEISLRQGLNLDVNAPSTYTVS